jgi:hypothetical protein
LLHYFHTCTHQVPYLVIPSVKWWTVKSFTQPWLHKLLILHLTHRILVHPTLEVNLQWEANLQLGGNLQLQGKFLLGETYMVATSTSLGESHSCKSFYPYYHWPVSWTSISRSCLTLCGVNPIQAGIPPQGTFPYQSINPMIPTTVPSIIVYGRSIKPTTYMGGPSGQSQYVGGPYVQSQYMGGQSGQPPYMGGQPRKPPYMGGPSSFFISSTTWIWSYWCSHVNMVITSIHKLTDNFHSWLH